jgi:hypothetical protein
MCTQTRTHTPPRALLASPKLTHRRACHSVTGTATDTTRPSAEAQCRCCAVKAELERASASVLCCRASLHTQRPRRSTSRPTAPSAAYFELLSVDSAMLRAPARDGSSQRTQIRTYVCGLCATVTTVLLRDRTDRVRRDLVLDHRRPAVSCHWQQPLLKETSLRPPMGHPGRPELQPFCVARAAGGRGLHRDKHHRPQ